MPLCNLCGEHHEITEPHVFVVRNVIPPNVPKKKKHHPYVWGDKTMSTEKRWQIRNREKYLKMIRKQAKRFRLMPRIKVKLTEESRRRRDEMLKEMEQSWR